MAQVFKTALGGSAPQEPTVFDKIMQQLADMDAAPPAPPTFTPEQQGRNIDQNNQLTQLGLLGQLSGDETVAPVGGQIFKQALARAQPQVTEKGSLDQLTGDFAPSPETVQNQRDVRKDRLFARALAAEEARRRGEDRIDAREDQQKAAQDNIRLAASLRPAPAGSDPEIVAARRDLLQAQAEAARGKVEAVGEKKQALKDAARLKAGLVIGKVDEANKIVGTMTTGVLGKTIGQIPGTPAYNLNAAIDTIKANIGFNELQAMRMASPTGGALGQVAVKELNMLQAVIANLDPGQDRKTLKRNLGQVRTHYENWLKTLEAPDTSGAPASSPGVSTSAPAGAPRGTTPSAGGAAPAAGGAPRQRLRLDPVTGELVPVR